MERSRTCPRTIVQPVHKTENGTDRPPKLLPGILGELLPRHPDDLFKLLHELLQILSRKLGVLLDSALAALVF